MRVLCRRDLRDEEGSIILALLGIVILATVAAVGLAAVVNGQAQSRHDNAYTQALDNAQSGLDAMVATIKNGYNSATAVSTGGPGTLSATNLNGTTKTGTYTATATGVNNIGQTGSAASTSWTIRAVGTATHQGHTITRVVTETVTIAHTYQTPVLGSSGLALGDMTILGVTTQSAVGDYQNSTTTTSKVIANGVTLPLGLGTTASTTITNVPVGGTPGAASTGGALSVSSSDVNNFAQIALDGPSASCTGTACSSSTIVTSTAPPPAIVTTGCASYGSGATLNGVGLTLPTGNLVLNTALVTQLDQNPPVAAALCTNLPIYIPAIGADLSGLGLTGSAATLDIPINANCGALPAPPTLPGNLSCAMNSPTNLYINEVGTSQITIGTPGSVIPDYISGVIASPNGTCQINGNVVLFGAINCKYITVGPSGGSLTVYYPTDAGLGFSDTQHQDTVTNWNECNRTPTAC